MTLRIHFRAADLLRTRLSRQPDPAWEIILSHARRADPDPVWPWSRWRRTLPPHPDTDPRVYHDQALTPHASYLRKCVTADLVRRIHAARTGGLDALFATFAPAFRWRPPVLEIDHPDDRDLTLDGHGLLLIPSFFCRHHPVLDANHLIYPINPDACHDHPVDQAVADLLGPTRAAVLTALDIPSTTTELATYLRIPASSVSRHTAVLRNAGLLTTRRDGRAVLHTRTPLGGNLLPPNANAGPAKALQRTLPHR